MPAQPLPPAPPVLSSREVAEAPDLLRRVKADHRSHYGPEATPANFRPLDGFVLFEREAPPDRAGVLYLAPKSDAAARKDLTWARVVKLGDPLMARKNGARIPFSLRVGDRVLLDRLAGHDVTLAGRPYVLAIESDVVLVEVPAEPA